MIAKPKYILLLFCLVLQGQIFAQTPDFTGTWVLNFEKSNLDKTDNLKGLTGQIFVIKQEDNKFALKIYHLYGDKKKKIGFSMLADGKTRRLKILFKGKLEQKGSSLQVTMWRKKYLNSVNYKFGINQNELVADEVFTGKPKDHHSIWVFDREIAK
jgi:predicted glycosyltransferase involved in capsule biosynthesis